MSCADEFGVVGFGVPLDEHAEVFASALIRSVLADFIQTRAEKGKRLADSR